MVRISVLVYLFFSIFPFCLFATSLYVVSDGYKILPNGSVVEFDRQPPGKLKDRNAIWNGTTREIRIAGARNEIIAFQIVLEGQADDITLECSGLEGPDAFPKANMSFHLVGYVSWQEAFYPDVVIPLTWKGITPFSIPYRISGLTPVPQQSAGVVMVEVKIPPQVAPGDYSGQIVISGGVNETLSLNLKVWDFVIPARPSIVFDFNSYGSPVESITQDNRNPYLPTFSET